MAETILYRQNEETEDEDGGARSGKEKPQTGAAGNNMETKANGKADGNEGAERRSSMFNYIV